MNSIIEKLENKERVQELNIPYTLEKLGLTKDKVFCDIGAGTGIFSIYASGITEKNVYAFDVSSEMIEIINKKKIENNIDNIIAKKIENDITLENESCDIALLSTVYHELENSKYTMKEIYRVLKDNGTLGIIEFHDKDSSYGPPKHKRVSQEILTKELLENNFILKESSTLSDNFYLSIFKK